MPQFATAALFLLPALASCQNRPWQRWTMDNVPPTGTPTSLGATKADSYPAPQYVVQPLDHFDKETRSPVWNQAYFVNDTFWTPGSNAPIFLCVGGEGPPMDGSAVVHSLHCNVAVEWLAEKKALMFALEHRFYGCHNMSACPVKDFNQSNALKYLSSHQAIEDAANFVRHMNKAYGLTDANKWVTFGGSYPGMLAGWSRLRHPELIHAAVASSAPVHAKLDMFEYNDALAHAYTVSDNGVGGSEECRAAIREGHRQLEVMLTTPTGVSSAEKALGLDKDSLNTTYAKQSILGSGVAYFPGQGNDPACMEEACNIGQICAIMVNKVYGDEFKRLLVVRKAQNAGAQLQASTELPDFWYYQTCTEFGFYQTCSKGSKCMFPQITDVQFMAQDCQDKYKITVPDIAANIDATNKHYGGVTPFGPSGTLGSCVVWPNGEVDPWATLSVLKSPGPEQPVIWVDGASHHAWTHPTLASDQTSVVEARGKIREQVEAFLGQDCSEKKLPQSQIVV